MSNSLGKHGIARLTSLQLHLIGLDPAPGIPSPPQAARPVPCASSDKVDEPIAPPFSLTPSFTLLPRSVAGALHQGDRCLRSVCSIEEGFHSFSMWVRPNARAQEPQLTTPFLKPMRPKLLADQLKVLHLAHSVMPLLHLIARPWDLDLLLELPEHPFLLQLHHAFPIHLGGPRKEARAKTLRVLQGLPYGLPDIHCFSVTYSRNSSSVHRVMKSESTLW